MKIYKVVRELQGGEFISLVNDVPHDEWYIIRGFFPQLRYRIGQETVDRYGIGIFCYRTLRAAVQQVKEMVEISPIVCVPVVAIAILQVEAQEQDILESRLCASNLHFPRKQDLEEMSDVVKDWILCRKVTPVRVRRCIRVRKLENRTKEVQK